VFNTRLTHYRSFRRRSFQPITWLVLVNKIKHHPNNNTNNLDRHIQITTNVSEKKLNNKADALFRGLLRHPARNRLGLFVQPQARSGLKKRQSQSFRSCLNFIPTPVKQAYNMHDHTAESKLATWLKCHSERYNYVCAPFRWGVHARARTIHAEESQLFTIFLIQSRLVVLVVQQFTDKHNLVLLQEHTLTSTLQHICLFNIQIVHNHHQSCYCITFAKPSIPRLMYFLDHRYITHF